jgi:hypothetical protein
VRGCRDNGRAAIPAGAALQCPCGGPGRPIASISGWKTWDLRKTLSRPAAKARVEYDIGALALHPGSIGPIFGSIIQRAFDLGALPDLTAEDLARLLKGISAHSTRIGLNQDLFASGGSRWNHGCVAVEVATDAARLQSQPRGGARSGRSVDDETRLRRAFAPRV